MIEIFNGDKLSFTKRVVRKIGFNLIFPVVLIVIILATGFYNTFTFKDPIFYLFPGYFLFFLISNIVKSKVYIRRILFDKYVDEIIICTRSYNCEKEYRFQKNDVELEIIQYGIYTRTRNFYLQVRIKNRNVLRQYDYEPWNYRVMKETVEKIKLLKVR